MTEHSLSHDSLYDIDLLAAILECCEYTFPLNPHLGKPNEYLYKHDPDGFKRRQATYRLAHPDRIRARSMNYRSRDKKRKSKNIEDDIQLIYRSQKGKCWWCGKKVGRKYHVDHRVPLSRGGTNNANNLVISCPDCNFDKKDKLPQEWCGRLF